MLRSRFKERYQYRLKRLWSQGKKSNFPLRTPTCKLHCMILISEKELLCRKYDDMIPIKCDICNKIYSRQQKFLKSQLKYHPNRKHYCSSECMSKAYTQKKEIKCKNCSQSVFKLPKNIKKYKNQFCSSSCAASYNNAHKIHGSKRSKLEKYLEQNLITLYPHLEFHFNRKDAINSELDIYIPKLSLAFELNGIFHYEPICGKDKLESIQNNDKRKFQACLEKGIELCVIDASSLKYFKPTNAQKYLDIVVNIINLKLLKNTIILSLS